jgi:hypothetical protein
MRMAAMGRLLPVALELGDRPLPGVKQPVSVYSLSLGEGQEGAISRRTTF